MNYGIVYVVATDINPLSAKKSKVKVTLCQRAPRFRGPSQLFNFIHLWFHFRRKANVKRVFMWNILHIRHLN